ncbi:gliding motility lipoprotein GldK [Bacteroidia bacterium]|nr:gliding motility lipoprotein GldK [Bacteroidia bacterium]
MPTPFGMVYVPGGYFTMGSGGEDVTYAMTYSPKQVSISAFYMDNTEITNNEYRQFVAWVTDSIMRRMLGETLPQFLIETDDPDAMPNINYRTAIKKSVEVDEALETLYLPNEERFYHKKELDVRKLNYEYQWFDYMQAAQKSWDNLEARTDGVNIASFINRPQSLKSRAGYVRKEIVNVYPDTLCWFIDFSYSYNDPYVRSYFSSPMYDHYPVVGVNWHQAQAFCQWRTITYNSVLASRGLSTEVFRLPTEAEWEFAARGGLDMNPYPWGGPYASNINGCFLGNFKPQRGRYSMDGGNRPVIVGHYAPNDYGLYDMMGNVSEWCEDAYSDSYDVLHDLDPVFKYRADESDHVTKKRKVIRGGSFKDFAEITKVYYRTYEYQDTCKSYVGFRCVMSYLGRARSDTKVSESNVY